MKDGTETDGCTFKPKILKKEFDNTRKSELEDLQEGADKWQELYLMAQSKKNIDKADRAHDEIEIEQNPDEYTFQPNAHKYKNGAPDVSRTHQNLLSSSSSR